MSCATPALAGLDLRDYYFDALSPEEARRVRQHLQSCASCAAEIDQLRITALALRALPDEEMPRRITFVSDKVFEPSPLARWFQAFWLSGARIASLAALVLAAALVIHAYRPAQVIRVVTPAPANAALNSHAGFDRNAMQAAVDQAVAKAVTQAEIRYDLKLKQVMAENEKQRRDTMERVATVLDSMDRRNRVLTVASNSLMDAGQ